jgi:hypothetical protein
MSLVKNYTLIFILISLAISCSKSSTPTTSETVIADTTSNVSQSAVSAANSSATSTEGGAVGFIQDQNNEANFSSDYIDPSDSIAPFSSACTLTASSTCSGSTATIAWASCTVNGGNGTMTGGWTEVFSSGACVRPLGAGLTITRTSTGSTITHANGSYTTTDTNGGTAWDGSVVPSTGETITMSNPSGTRTIVNNGIHKIRKSAKGITLFDHLITSTGMTITGTRAGNNRVITGTQKLYHNIAKFTATNTFNSVTYSDATCCFPTSGSISSVLTGSKTGTISMAFSTTCGTASFTDTTGTVTATTLDHCN